MKKKCKILFVCSGNVGRSQIAESFYNHFTHSNNASSAGIDKMTPQKYSHPTKEIIQAMKEENIDVSKNKIKAITKNMIKNYNQIIVLCQKEECPKFLLKHKKITFWDIKDPFEATLEETIKVKNIIKSKVLSII